MVQNEQADPLTNLRIIEFRDATFDVSGSTGLASNLSGSLYISGGTLVFQGWEGTFTDLGLA